MAKLIQHHYEPEVFKKGFGAAMIIFQVSKDFPKEETYSLTDQIRRSSRSVCANLAEAWRKRRYEAAFISKLNDAEAEAAETQVWLHFAVKSQYLSRDRGEILFRQYDEVLRLLVSMINNAHRWTFSGPKNRLH